MFQHLERESLLHFFVLHCHEFKTIEDFTIDLFNFACEMTPLPKYN